jgi:glutamyl-tRNA synthetase
MTTSYSNELIDLLIPEALPAIEEIEAKYPPRKLAEGQKVVRIPPSPTGFVHIGNISTFFINERIAHQGQNGGIVYLRIEDTDQKREVQGATELIINTLAEYNIRVDEGPTTDGKEVGAYGPYVQSKRGKIYKAYVKKLLREGKAYPCFCTGEELEAMRKTQEYEGVRPGYYGKWAVHRNLSEAEIREKLAAKLSFTFRMRSFGDAEKYITVDDLIKGERQLPEWDEDTIIMKSESGLPTYHFAHVIDDHLMGTTHVIRGEEWFSSLPRHIQMFAAMGWKAPKYGHIAPLQKLDNGNRRKLSKRHDPEASMTYYAEKGYPRRAVLEYLLTLANSNFEDWRRANPKRPYEEFPFSMKKMGTTGALFDFVKLDNISKDFISKMSADEIFSAAYDWAQKYCAPLKFLMDGSPDYVKAILNIERTGPKVRKDITMWSDLLGEMEYFFDDSFSLTKEKALELLPGINPADVAAAAQRFAKSYDGADTKDAWFEKVKKIAAGLGYAVNMKEFQANPAAYKGSVSDIAKIFRVLLTGRAQTPDLHSVMSVMGGQRCLKRLALL